MTVYLAGLKISEESPRRPWVTGAHIALPQLHQKSRRALRTLVVDIFAGQMDTEARISKPRCNLRQKMMHLAEFAKKLWNILRDCICVPTTIPDVW